MALVFGSFLLINFRQNEKVNWARIQAIPQIEQLSNEMRYTEAYQIAVEAEKYLPKDSQLEKFRLSSKEGCL